MAWAEDRAPWRHDPSADPGTKTEGGGTMPPCLSLRDWYERGKSSYTGHLFRTIYLPTPVSPFHAEPLHQLQPTLFYAWQKLFFENGASAFERKNGSAEQVLVRTIAALRDKLQRKNEVVAELMEEHIQLKKELGEL